MNTTDHHNPQKAYTVGRQDALAGVYDFKSLSCNCSKCREQYDRGQADGYLESMTQQRVTGK